MSKHFFILAAIVLITVMAIISMKNFGGTVPSAQESAQPVNSTLKVSNQGSQMTTDVSGGDLQQAAPPNRSATSPELNPQQAKPNYCEGNEMPVQDGCLPSQ